LEGWIGPYYFIGIISKIGWRSKFTRFQQGLYTEIVIESIQDYIGEYKFKNIAILAVTNS